MNTDALCQMNHPHGSSVALLIDGENGSASMAGAMLSRAGEWGEVVVRRVYGDWSSPQMRPWRGVVTQYGMRAVHQHLPKKNAADIALTADAVDLFYQGFRQFCLSSGDSDFVPLVLWLREHHCLVIVMSRKDGPQALQQACSVFVSSEQLCPTPHECSASQEAALQTENGASAAQQRRPRQRTRRKQKRSQLPPARLFPSEDQP
jgi:hypothetical protein